MAQIGGIEVKGFVANGRWVIAAIDEATARARLERDLGIPGADLALTEMPVDVITLSDRDTEVPHRVERHPMNRLGK